MLTVSLSRKDLFFDRAKIQRSLDRATRQAMSRQLAFIRRRARSSLRRRKRASAPGQTPSIHTTDPTASLKNIQFSYDPTLRSGVVGPVKLNRISVNAAKTRTTVPNTLETGGEIIQYEEFVELRNQPSFWRRVDRRRKQNNRKKRYRRYTIKERPFMMPALMKEVEAGTIMDPWEGVFGE